LVLAGSASVGLALHFGSLAEGTLWVVFGFLPAVQLAASLLSTLFVLLWPADERPLRWRAIGRITLWTFLGTTIGLLLMGPCLLALLR
jgi:hypothetical protein